MDTKISFALFFLIFIFIYTILNSYVVLRLGGLMEIKRNILYLWIVLVTFSLPIAMYSERIFPNILSRIFYTLAVFWMGILLLTLCSLLIYEIISYFHPLPQAGIIISILVSALSIISIINASTIVVKEVEVPIKNLKNKITIVQLSDIHLGTIRNSGFLEKIIKKTNQLDPDIVMITGDLVEGNAGLYKNMFNDFNKLKAPIYFVTGNHEVYEGADKVYAILNDTKVKALRNEVVDFGDIQIIGVEFSEDKDQLKKELEKLNIDETKPAVLMYHYPEGIEEAKKAKIDLQLSGHTHFGQIFPFNLLVMTRFKYIKGLYDLGSMFLHVSPGTGTWGPYMRLGSRNEITLIKLVAK